MDSLESNFGYEVSILPDAEPAVPKSKRNQYQVIRIKRDASLVRRLKIWYENKCQICQKSITLEDDLFYSEAHHIKPLGAPCNGPDIAENIIIVCPNDHVRCDYHAMALEIEKLTIHPQHSIAQSYLDYHNQIRQNKSFC